MKKILFILLVSFTFVFSLFSQENEISAATPDDTSLISSDELIQEDNVKENLEMDIGAYYSHGFNIGNIHDFSKQKLGGGVSYELTFPFFTLMGASTRIEYYYLFSELERVRNWQNINFLVGAFFNIPIVDDIVLFRPELSYGIILNLMNLDGKTSTYVDQIFEIGASFRISHPVLKNKGFSFEIAPTYTIFPQKNDAGQNIGFRSGVIYEF